MSVHLLFIIIVLIACGCVDNQARAQSDDREDAVAIDFATLAEEGIVPYIGRRVLVSTAVAWHHHEVSIPEDPRSPEEIARQAGPLLIRIGTDDDPAFKDLRPSRRHLRGIGAQVRTIRDDDGREGYAIGATTLTKDHRYRLVATLRLRDNFDEKMLDNPAFVKQTNDPRYWSQTLELELHTAQPADKD